jgi:hypothetical protein
MFISIRISMIAHPRTADKEVLRISITLPTL